MVGAWLHYLVGEEERNYLRPPWKQTIGQQRVNRRVDHVEQDFRSTVLSRGRIAGRRRPVFFKREIEPIKKESLGKGRLQPRECNKVSGEIFGREGDRVRKNSRHALSRFYPNRRKSRFLPRERERRTPADGWTRLMATSRPRSNIFGQCFIASR